MRPVGERYYLFSAFVRPAGILLISWGWVEIFSVRPPFRPSADLILPLQIAAALAVLIVASYDRLLRGALVSILLLRLLLAIPSLEFYPFVIKRDYLLFLQLLLLTLGWSAWSILRLGLRESFLYARLDDRLETGGPYRYQRHPQLFAAVAGVFFSIFLVQPSVTSNFSGNYIFRLVNFVVMCLAMGLIIRREEMELEERMGEEYRSYRASTPRDVRRARQQAPPGCGLSSLQPRRWVGLFPFYYFLILLSRSTFRSNLN
ncbi:MAG: hypothetical protein MZU91_06820 [Desulfosudis oleivorans]|nr:hypothetical protein [Desulfosudis oleivorans]